MKHKTFVHQFLFYDNKTGIPVMSCTLFVPEQFKGLKKFSVEVDPAKDEAHLHTDGGFFERLQFATSQVETKKEKR